MAEYKKGDWVRYPREVGDIEAGAIARVSDAYALGSYLVQIADGRKFYAHDLEIEPWQPKVGERVRVVKTIYDGENLQPGATGPITEHYHTTCYGVQIDCDSWSFFTEDLEPVTDPLPVAEQPAAPAATVDITAATVDAINDEYGPVVAVVDSPKFKVGDVVKFRDNYASSARGKKATVVALNVWGDDGVQVDKDGDISTEAAVDLELVAPTTAIVALIENGQPLPATRPAVHTSAEAADAEARRLAGIHKGQEFGVFVLTGTHKEAKVYEHEWQRLAAEGEKIRAIRALRAAAGTDLKSAKDAVEFFTAYRAA